MKSVSYKLWIPLLMLLLACITSAALYWIRTEQYQNWVPTDGIILNIEQYHNSGKHGSGSSHRISYSYTVNGKDYSGSNLYSGRDSGFQIGDSVQVWYDPEQVSDSSFHKPGPGLDPYVPFIMGVPLTGIALHIAGKYSRQKKGLQD